MSIEAEIGVVLQVPFGGREAYTRVHCSTWSFCNEHQRSALDASFDTRPSYSSIIKSLLIKRYIWVQVLLPIVCCRGDLPGF